MTSNPPPKPPTDDSLLLALEVACRPTSLSPSRHEEILARALGLEPAALGDDQFLPPSDEETAEAGRLALALEDGGRNELAELARALRAAQTPDDLSELGLRRALTCVEPSAKSLVSPTPRWRRLKTVAFTTGAAALAWAASVGLIARSKEPAPLLDAERTAFATSRSLSPLFSEPGRTSTPTERIDRIVMARSRDLRHNRYLAWRVR